MREVGGAAEVTPIILVGAEGYDFLALGREAEIGIDDGKDAPFGEEGEETGGEGVDTGEGERKWRVASDEGRVGRKSRFSRHKSLGMSRRGISRFARNDGIFIFDAATDELEIVVEEELARGCAGLDG